VTKDVDFWTAVFRAGGPEAELAIKLGRCTGEMFV
jgi:hypothetical protein